MTFSFMHRIRIDDIQCNSSLIPNFSIFRIDLYMKKIFGRDILVNGVHFEMNIKITIFIVTAQNCLTSLLTFVCIKSWPFLTSPNNHIFSLQIRLPWFFFTVNACHILCTTHRVRTITINNSF